MTKTTKFEMDRPWVFETELLIFKIDTEFFQIIFKLIIFHKLETKLKDPNAPFDKSNANGNSSFEEGVLPLVGVSFLF